MGPSVILDKSAVEAIGKDALHVQSENFYTVVTPILVWEVCGDIEKAREGKCDPEKVQSLASKAKPFNSIVTTEWRKLCIAELSGLRFKKDVGGSRRAQVSGGHRVPLPNGKFGNMIDHQPEADALLRWQCGQWTESDMQYSQAWRRVAKGIDLNAIKRRFGSAKRSISSPEDLIVLVDRVLADPSLQYFLLRTLIDEITTDDTARRQLIRPWERNRGWPSHAWYSRVCIRTFMTFYLALSEEIIGTRSSNRIDLEYLLYAPFAPIFISGDEGTHGKLAPILLERDQIFVRADDFRNAMQSEVDRRIRLRSSVPPPDPDAFEPPEGSLIRSLWLRTWGKFRPPPSSRSPRDPDTSTRAQTIAAEFQEAMRYVDANPDRYPKRKPWPHC